MMRTRLSIAGAATLVALMSAGPAGATFTILPAGTGVSSINDDGAVTGTEANGLGFLRTPDGTITTFSAASGAQITAAVSINASDSIAGYYVDQGSRFHGFIRDANGTITTFDVAKHGLDTFPRSINALGAVTGSYGDRTGHRQGFVRAPDGAITTFHAPRVQDATPTAINDNGVIVGFYPVVNVTRAFIRTADGKITGFDVPGNNISTMATSINNDGVITGSFIDATRTQYAFVRFSDGHFNRFGGFGKNFTPSGINASGAVTGTYFVSRLNRQFGFVRQSDGLFQKLNAPGANGGTFASSINASGAVGGSFAVHRRNPIDYGYIWTPN
jgi:hypothetical protein